MNQDTLFARLKKYGETDIYPFHMPGHKRRLMPGETGSIYKMDITEIDGFDNLHEAEGILKEAQNYAAALYHSQETAFLVNGSTAGILAAIAGVCEDGGTLAVARNCHKSVYHAIELHHLKPVYIYPPINTRYGINEGIYPQDVDKLWITHSDIQAVVITSPTYEGVVSDVREISRIAHSHGVPLIVDAAHGAHFGFSDYFPESAVECGADVVILSTHKTLPAMTQTALIHLNGSLIDRERIHRMQAVYQSSSPSYLLMGSIDACMHMLAERGEALYGNYTAGLQTLREAVHGLKYVSMPELSDFNEKYTKDYDRSKLVLSVRGLDRVMNGKGLYERLLKDYGLQMEMMSADYVLAMTSVGDDWSGYERLIAALREIDGEIGRKVDHTGYIDERADSHQCGDKEPEYSGYDRERMDSHQYGNKEPEDCRYDCEREGGMARLPEMPQLMSIYEAGRLPKRICDLEAAVGYGAADYIYLYPPGIPLVTPGEMITTAVVSVIERWLRQGLHVNGIDQGEKGPAVRIIITDK